MITETKNDQDTYIYIRNTKRNGDGRGSNIKYALKTTDEELLLLREGCEGIKCTNKFIDRMDRYILCICIFQTEGSDLCYIID